MTTNTARPTTLPIQVARTILTGDVGAARSLAGRGFTSLRVAEARALYGAINAANHRWGCGLDINQFWTVRA